MLYANLFQITKLGDGTFRIEFKCGDQEPPKEVACIYMTYENANALGTTILNVANKRQAANENKD